MQLTTQRALSVLAIAALGLASCSSSKRDQLDAPRISSLSPAEDAVAVATDAEVRVVFDRKLRASSINESTFQVRDVVADTFVDGTRLYDAESKTAIFRPASPLAGNRVYEVVVADKVKSERYGIELRHGRRAWRFTTSSAAASQLEHGLVEWQLQQLTQQFAEGVNAGLAADDEPVSDPEVLFALALHFSQAFAVELDCCASKDFATVIALSLLGEDVALQLRDVLEQSGRFEQCDLNLVDWSNIPADWDATLRRNTSGFFEN